MALAPTVAATRPPDICPRTAKREAHPGWPVGRFDDLRVQLVGLACLLILAVGLPVFGLVATLHVGMTRLLAGRPGARAAAVRNRLASLREALTARLGRLSLIPQLR